MKVVDYSKFPGEGCILTIRKKNLERLQRRPEDDKYTTL